MYFSRNLTVFEHPTLNTRRQSIEDETSNDKGKKLSVKTYPIDLDIDYSLLAIECSKSIDLSQHKT